MFELSVNDDSHHTEMCSGDLHCQRYILCHAQLVGLNATLIGSARQSSVMQFPGSVISGRERLPAEETEKGGADR